MTSPAEAPPPVHEPPAPKRYRFWMPLATMGLAGMLGLLLLELAVRIAFPHHVSRPAIEAHLERVKGAPSMTWSDNIERLYRLRPNFERTVQGVTVRTDAQGYRTGDTGTAHTSRTADTPFADSPSAVRPGAVRIALVGDSTPFGWMVNYHDTYGEQLRRLLEAETSRPVELRNFSIYGYNSRMELELIKEDVLPWKPDLLLLHHDFNDAEPAGSDVPRDYLPPAYGDNALHSALIKFVKRKLKARERRGEWAAYQSDPPTRKIARYAYTGPSWDDHAKALDQIAEVCRKNKIVPVAFLFDMFMQPIDVPAEKTRYDVLYGALKPRVAAAGYHMIEMHTLMQPVLRERNWPHFKAWWNSPTDSHPNPAGHRALAELLARELTANPDVRRLFQ